MNHRATGAGDTAARRLGSPEGSTPAEGCSRPLLLPHCLICAKERYGLDISIEDLKALTRRCHDGEGLMKNVVARAPARAHMLVYGSRVLECVWVPPNGDYNTRGVIVTIYPSGTLGALTTYHDVRNMKRRQRRG